MLVRLAYLGGGNDLATSELERAGLTANRQSVEAINADSKRAV